jgi:hypothetical protein
LHPSDHANPCGDSDPSHHSNGNFDASSTESTSRADVNPNRDGHGYVYTGAAHRDPGANVHSNRNACSADSNNYADVNTKRDGNRNACSAHSNSYS